MKIQNKEIIQSYIFTTAKYNFSVYEKRILYRLIELIQDQLKGKKIDESFSFDKDLFGNRLITMPINAFLVGDDDKNYSRVKKALKDLRNKTFEYEADNVWKLIGIIEKPKFDIAGFVEFEIQVEIFQAILKFSKGYRKFELKTAMEFDSHYTMRFYELFSGQKQPITYSIERLKIMFDIVDKYQDRPSDFVKYVIVTAKKELDNKSPYSFEYKTLKKGKKITAIQFHPFFIPENQDNDLVKASLQKQISPSWELDKMVINYLKQNFFFTTKEIQNNIDLLKLSNEKLDLMLELSKIKPKAQEAKSTPQAYVIGTLKKMLNVNNNSKKASQKNLF